jgi:hypothetical protein
MMVMIRLTRLCMTAATTHKVMVVKTYVNQVHARGLPISSIVPVYNSGYHIAPA